MVMCDIHSFQITISRLLPTLPITRFNPLEWGRKILHLLHLKSFRWLFWGKGSTFRSLNLGSLPPPKKKKKKHLPVILVLWRKCSNYKHIHTLGLILLSMRGFGMRQGLHPATTLPHAAARHWPRLSLPDWNGAGLIQSSTLGGRCYPTGSVGWCNYCP